MHENGTSDAPASTLGRRSRSGCLECRKRRKKCDEGHPICSACLERGAECRYRDSISHTALVPIKPASKVGPKVLVNPTQTDTSTLIHHFDRTVANLISFSRSDTTNPFFTNILPLVPQSKLVQSAVESVASAHLAVLGPGSQFDAHHLQSRTLSLLAQGLSRENVSDVDAEQLLAATLLLIYYEIVLGNSVSTARCHLQGARAILQNKPHLITIDSPRARFIFKAFQYFDVMVALSLHEEPLLPCFPKSINMSEIDETFGLTGSLWPYLYHLAVLLARHKRGEDVTKRACILEQKLQSWSIEDAAISADIDKEAMMQIAQTYRYSTLLMLYTSILVPGGAVVHQTQVLDTQKAAIDSMLRVCVLSGTMSTLVWPLYTVAMSSTSASDKIVLQHVFSKLLERQNMKVVEGARDKILQAWDNKDPDGVIQYDPQAPEVLLG